MQQTSVTKSPTGTKYHTNDIEVTHVTSRSGVLVPFDLVELIKRVDALRQMRPELEVNVQHLVMGASGALTQRIHTHEIDDFLANCAASKAIINPQYLALANRLAVSNHQKSVFLHGNFLKRTLAMQSCPDSDGSVFSKLQTGYVDFVTRHAEDIHGALDYWRDFDLQFFGIRTLQRGYMMSINGPDGKSHFMETPQDMFMRVSIYIHGLGCCSHDQDDVQGGGDDEASLQRVLESYEFMSLRQLSHASPTLFNAGTHRSQLASCFLLHMGDSTKKILQTFTDACRISSMGGGIGIDVSSVRAKGSLIRRSGGLSTGLFPFLKMLEGGAKAFNQGGKRPGSFAMYMMPHHPEIEEFIKWRDMHTGSEVNRAPGLFYAVWLPDLFMERVKANGPWSFFDSSTCGDLSMLSGDEYTRAYEALEVRHMATKTIKARDLMVAIYNSNVMTGLPYVCFADNVNRHSNQKNLGTIKCSNLCAEIMQYSSSEETAVCNLASLALPRFVVKDADSDVLRYDLEGLYRVARQAVRNLDKVIDRTYYPTDRTRRSNLLHRPMGVGVQGLADVFCMMRVPFDSTRASHLNKMIFETINFACLTESAHLARSRHMRHREATRRYWRELEQWDNDDPCPADRSAAQVWTHSPPTDEDGLCVYHIRSSLWETEQDIPTTSGAYPSYLWNGGCPLSKGIFQWESYGLKEADLATHGVWDWEGLRQLIARFGVRHSLLEAVMPTASSSRILGHNECIEPYTSNQYVRNIGGQQLLVTNQHMETHLRELDLWSKDVVTYMRVDRGSIRAVPNIPEAVKAIYKTAFELDQSVLVQQSVDRQPFVGQGQSLNWYIDNPSFGQFLQLTFQAWRGGAKTANYYMHTPPASEETHITVPQEVQDRVRAAVAGMTDMQRQTSAVSDEDLKGMFLTPEGCLGCTA